MNDTRSVQLTHVAEAMKIFPPNGFPPTEPPSYGFVTQGAIALVEIQRPNVNRSFCIAISAVDFPASRPSTWSGALDQAAAGSMPGDMISPAPASERPKRLIMVATGNVAGGTKSDVLPCSPIEDPAQSWNALTIGGFIRKEQPPAPPPPTSIFLRSARRPNPGRRSTYRRGIIVQTTGTGSPVVAANNRSPFSRGSQSLPDDLTPIKPELLFEAGNMLSDATESCAWEPSVSLLSTGSDVVTEPLVPFWATSAAVGVAGYFMGRLQASFPSLWPETYRALAVNSASWPRPIRKRLVGRGAHWKAKSKADLQQIIREVGYGVPNVERAIMSARNDVTLIAQAEIQPFSNGDGKGGVFNELHFYSLHWPKTALEQLESEIVVMKVTLSYFIEPNLTGRAATRPDTYRSFGLRFSIKKRRETEKDFRSRRTIERTRRARWRSEPRVSRRR
jgi:hypothetical protein